MTDAPQPRRWAAPRSQVLLRQQLLELLQRLVEDLARLAQRARAHASAVHRPLEEVRDALHALGDVDELLGVVLPPGVGLALVELGDFFLVCERARGARRR